MSEMTHADKISLVQKLLQEIAHDAERLDAITIDELVMEVGHISHMMESRIYGAYVYDPSEYYSNDRQI